jgi:hypothetical protein
VQRRFFVALGHAIRLAWPVLSIILAIQVALGLLTGFVESWSVADAIYFTFVTGLTIGYGDNRAAAGAWACTCGWDWYLWARTHGPHNGDCGLCPAHSACRAQKQLTQSQLSSLGLRVPICQQSSRPIRYSRRQLFANAVMAASRVGLSCVGVQSFVVRP